MQNATLPAARDCLILILFFSSPSFRFSSSLLLRRLVPRRISPRLPPPLLPTNGHSFTRVSRQEVLHGRRPLTHRNDSCVHRAELNGRRKGRKRNERHFAISERFSRFVRRSLLTSSIVLVSCTINALPRSLGLSLARVSDGADGEREEASEWNYRRVITMMRACRP